MRRWCKVFALLIAAVNKVTIAAHKVEILVNHVPYLLYAGAVETAVAHHLWSPAALGHWEEMERIAEVGGGKLAAVNIITVALVDDDSVGNLHYSALYSLQLIACARNLYKQEEIHHGVTCCLALPHSNSLNKHLVESGSLAENNCLTRLACHTS